MSKFLTVLCLLLIISCVTVGAYNLIANTSNRPRGVYDLMQFSSSFELSMDELSSCVGEIEEMWSDFNSSSTNTSSPSITNNEVIDRIIDYAFTGVLNLLKDASDKAGATEIHDFVSKLDYGFTAVLSTIINILRMVAILAYDTIRNTITIFRVVYGFFVGVPT